MLKLTRKLEYSLIALSHMQQKDENELSTTKEISEKFCKGHHIIYLLIFIISCTAEKGNDLGMIIDDAYINFPLKGQMISVGYFKLSNNSSETKVLNKIFCQDLIASLHTSYLSSEGMLTMKPIKDILIERNSAIRLLVEGKFSIFCISFSFIFIDSSSEKKL